MLQYDLEFDISRFQLRTKNYKTCSLRLTAFASKHRTDPSAAEAGIFFHLRRGRRWLSDESIKNKTHRYLCHKDFFQDLDTLLDPLATLKIFQTMLLELDLGDGQKKLLAEKWADEVSNFAFVAATMAAGMQAKKMTMVVEFSGVKIENYEDKDMMNCEDSEEEEEDTLCCICSEGMDEEEEEGLTCLHSFHRSCIKTWFQHQRTCPLCRSEEPLREWILRR